MKISGWIGIVCLSLCNFSLSATMNLMENGSFEQGLKGWRIDKIGNPDAEAVLVKDMASDGKQSLNITFKGNRKSNVYITVWKSLKLQPLTKYRLRFQAKAQNSRSFWAGIEYQPLVRSKGGTADWQEYLFEFTTKSNSQVHFRFLVEEQAENIWLDNVVLEKVVKNSSSSPVEQSILAFGAKPDGSSDSTAAFQKAVEAGVSRIFIPEGVFAVKELVLPDNISITGCGENSCLIPFSEDQKFVIRGGNNARFSDFAVDCRGRKTQGLFFFRTGNVMIERVFVSNSGTFGINLDHVVDAVIRDCVIRATHTGIMQTYCSNLRTVRNTVLDSTKHGIQFWSQDHWRPQFRTRNLWFCDNFVKNASSGEGGIWGVGVIGVVMSGNVVDGAKDVGLDLEWCEDAVVSGNVVRNTEHGGISLFFSCKNVTITGNTVYNNRIYAKEPEGYWVRAGIWLTYRNVKTFRNDTGHENITISGNTVINGPGKRRSVWIGCGRNVLIRGNQFIGAPVYHGGEHGKTGVPIKEYDGTRDYAVNFRGEIFEWR